MYSILFYIALFIGIVPLLILLSKKRAFDTRHPIIPFIWLTALATVYEFVGTGLLKLNTSYWFQTYSFLEFLTLYYFFYRLLEYHYPMIYRVLFTVSMFFCVISFIFWNETDKFTSLAINKTNITLFVLISFYLWFRNLFNRADIINLWRYDIFYFVSAFFMYYFSTFLLFLLGKFVFDSSIYAKDYWVVNVLATFILRILLITGVWKMKKSLK